MAALVDSPRPRDPIALRDPVDPPKKGLNARTVSKILLGVGITLAIIGVIALIAGIILSQVGLMTFAISLALKVTSGVALCSGLPLIAASLIQSKVLDERKKLD